MLFISETTYTTAQVKAVIENNKEEINDDYYNAPGNRSGKHYLPLAVASYIEGDITSVTNGYTVTDGLLMYSSSAGNMIGLYYDWSAEVWFFFMSGRRHGIPVSYFFKEVTPEYNPDNTHAYVSNNTAVSPFAMNVKMDEANNNAGSTWPLEPTNAYFALSAFIDNGTWTGNITKLKKDIATTIVIQEDVPVDITSIDFTNVILGMNLEGVVPSITIGDVVFQGDISRVGDSIVIDQYDSWDKVTIIWWYDEDKMTITCNSNRT